MTIEKYFLNREHAMKMMDIGFNEPCLMYWDNKGDLKYHNPPHYSKNGVFISTPMVDQVREWFLREYNIYGYVEKYEMGYGVTIVVGDNSEELYNGTFYHTYQEALKHQIDSTINEIKRRINIQKYMSEKTP